MMTGLRIGKTAARNARLAARAGVIAAAGLIVHGSGSRAWAQLAQSPPSADAQQFIVYQPATNVFFHPQVDGPGPNFLLQYNHRVSGREVSGPSYAFMVEVQRTVSPKIATGRCESGLERQLTDDVKYRHRIAGYACAYVQEWANARERTQSRIHKYAKCSYVVSIVESTRLMPLPPQAPTAPLVTALDRAVAALHLGECTDDVQPQAKPPVAAAPPPPQQQQKQSDAGQPPQQTNPAQPPAPPVRVIVRGRDGKYHIMTLAEAAAAGASPPQFTAPNVAGEFLSLGSTPLLIGPPMQSYVDGQLVLPPLPNAPPGYKTKFDLAYDWAEAKVIAEANWARENKAQAAIAVLSLAVSMALPELPAVAALGPLGAALVGGLTAPVLSTSTTSFVTTLTRTGSTGSAALQAGKDAALVILTGVPSAVGGETFKAVAGGLGANALVTSIAEHAGSAAGDFAVQYGPSVLAQRIPVNAQSTVSFKPQLAR